MEDFTRKGGRGGWRNVFSRRGWAGMIEEMKKKNNSNILTIPRKLKYDQIKASFGPLDSKV